MRVTRGYSELTRSVRRDCAEGEANRRGGNNLIGIWVVAPLSRVAGVRVGEGTGVRVVGIDPIRTPASIPQSIFPAGAGPD
jgi:hypothetical protein